MVSPAALEAIVLLKAPASQPPLDGSLGNSSRAQRHWAPKSHSSSLQHAIVSKHNQKQHWCLIDKWFHVLDINAVRQESLFGFATD